MGWCRQDDHVIEVYLGTPPREVAATLLHEILHAMWDEGHANGGDEEKVVQIFTSQWMRFFQDNKDVLSFLIRHARK